MIWKFLLSTFILSHTATLAYKQQVLTENKPYWFATEKKEATFKLASIYHSGVGEYEGLFRKAEYEEEETAEEYRLEHIRNNLLKSNGNFSVQLGETKMFNPYNRDTVLTVARMTANSYTAPGRPNWINIGDWKVNATFGWQSHGLRGYIFGTESKDIIVIVFKGTSIIGNPTAHIDKYNDNLMFSCCCGSPLRVSNIKPLMKPICGCATGRNQCNRFCLGQVTRTPNSYYHHALKIYETVSERYPNAEIWLTGHSLGGALSSLVGIQKGLPAFTFEAPGELMYARRLNLPLPEDMSTLPIYHFGNTADPVYVGSCNGPGSLCSIAGYAMESKCHSGNVCTFDTVGEMGWKLSLHNHKIRRIIDELLVPWKYFESPVSMKCEVENECVDCGLWKYV